MKQNASNPGLQARLPGLPGFQGNGKNCPPENEQERTAIYFFSKNGKKRHGGIVESDRRL